MKFIENGSELLSFLIVGMFFLLIPWINVQNPYIMLFKVHIFIKILLNIFGILFFYLAYKIYKKTFNDKQAYSNLPKEIEELKDLQEIAFWIDFFNKLPFPIFIKKLSRGKEQHEHILMNNAMKQFESNEYENKRFQGDIDKRLEDYITGDEITYEKGMFKQIELCMNMEEGVKPSIILTLKHLLVFNDNSYILGIYLPVEPKNIENKEKYKIKTQNGQLVLSINEASKKENGIFINVGKAIRENFENVLNT